MGKVRRRPNLLQQRLEAALSQGREIRVRVTDGYFSGVPTYLDAEFVELVNLYVPEAEEEEEFEPEPYERTVWLIRLSKIVAIADASDAWSKEDLEKLLSPQEIASETDD